MSKASLAMPPLTGIQDRNVQSALQAIANWARAINADYVSKDELKLPSSSASTTSGEQISISDVINYLKANPVALKEADIETLKVIDGATFAKRAQLQGGVTVSSGLAVSGGASITGATSITGYTSIAGGLVVSQGRIYWHNDQDGINYDVVELLAQVMYRVGML